MLKGTVVKVAIYVRVSTTKQASDNQLDTLTEAAKRHDWEVTQVFKDDGISGAKGKDQRPGLAALELAIGQRKFDKVLVFSLDRLGRSTAQLVTLVDEMAAKGVGLYVHQLGMDTDTPAGKLVLTVMAGLAEMERSLIRERVKAGLVRARQRGKTLGRPSLAPSVKRKIKQLRAQGVSWRKTAVQCGVSLSTVQRVMAQG